MYSKIAFKNVKKSFKDYTIYFFTLMLAVCIFYTFNSVESQKAMSELTSSGECYVDILSKVISYVSVFIAFILGSLILYANNFLVKKRNMYLISDGVQSKENQRTDLQQDKWNTGIAYPKPTFF